MAFGAAQDAAHTMSDASDPVRAAFDKFDADGSGRLERGELLKVLEELGLDVRGDADFLAFAEALMEDYDADGNGELDFEEFKKLYAQCLASEKAYAEELREAVGGLVGGALSRVSRTTLLRRFRRCTAASRRARRSGS